MKIIREIKRNKIRGKQYESEKEIQEKIRGNAKLRKDEMQG